MATAIFIPLRERGFSLAAFRRKIIGGRVEAPYVGGRGPSTSSRTGYPSTGSGPLFRQGDRGAEVAALLAAEVDYGFLEHYAGV